MCTKSWGVIKPVIDGDIVVVLFSNNSWVAMAIVVCVHPWEWTYFSKHNCKMLCFISSNDDDDDALFSGFPLL